jgi:NurA domain
MPLRHSELLQMLIEKQTDFQDYHQSVWKDLHVYRTAIREVEKLSDKSLNETLRRHISSGALLLESWKGSREWVIPSKLKWSNREESMDWVKEKLDCITTFAVDGSQIFPSTELSVPIALVQIGWFENPHTSTGDYDKNIKLSVLSPLDLGQISPGQPLDRQVSMQRFRMEIDRLIEFMESHGHCTDCLVFLDGALVATFAEAIDPDCRGFYVQCLLKLLRTSEKTRVPVVGYIDTSNARDLVTMLQCLQPLPDSPTIHDASLMGAEMKWGARTPAFVCARGKGVGREGVLKDYEEQAERIIFTYLKTNDRPPARLEMPLWIYEDGRLEEVLDYVRAEVIVGGGYPYAIETADQVAVIQSRDRQEFYRLLQDWAETADIPLSFSRKIVSKMMRRS